MSHSVTITRTTTTSSTSAIILNTGYLKTLPGLLKLAETILGIVCVGIVGYFINRGNVHILTAELFFLLMTVACLIATTCLLLSCLCSLSTGSIIAKTSYELIYHSIAFILLLAASLTLLIEVNHWKSSYYKSYKYDEYLAAAIIGLVNSVLYFLSAFFAFRTYRMP